MQAILDYIEENLRAAITPEELAARAGYSPWHFYRVFAGAVGLSVGGYIQKRRLDRALEEIARGSSGIDAALAYGFDTYAGFYKAFVRMYGCTPKQYLALYGPHQSTYQKETIMKQYMQKELRAVLASWDIPQNLPIGDIYIMDGAKVAGNVWKVGGEYILKAAPRETLTKNLRIAGAIAAQGLPANLPVPTKDGAQFRESKGREVFLLTRGVVGAPLGKAERFGEDRAAFGEKYGRSIAGLHRALAEIEGDILPDEANLFAQVRDWAMPNVRKQNIQWKMCLPESFFERWLSEFGALYDALPKQLIHRDPNPSNILFHNGEVSGFIDFDLSERNIRLWDPCYCATGLLSEWRGVKDIQAKWPALLEGILRGYDSVNPLTPEEKRAVFHVLCAIQMVCAAYFEGVDDPHYRELAKTNREMLVYIARRCPA
ncbi:MAG: helix-turn-helix domain-containing protein [Oscillospiraceae bacterium]|nr:helix-turn-helix domain-containing protein [Oscillospiraceae bacterium]